MRNYLFAAAVPVAIAAASPALAAAGGPVALSDSVTIDPIIDARLRYEAVDQPDLDREADALTMRVRAGAELRLTNLSLLVEGEGTLGLVDDYNAFPFASASRQRRPGFSVVADPHNVELNRAQVQYRGKGLTLTAGRQRINLDDQRWVGNVGWRQNEQTFDAVRGEGKLGPVAIDATYSWSQRTIFGIDAGSRQGYSGEFFMGGAGIKAGPVAIKGFAYLLDYDEPFVLASSSQTYGARASASFPLGSAVKLDLAASYARQMDWKANPADYSADYLSADAALGFKGFSLTGGYEQLGSDNGVGLQTPMATLHKFNGWADVFLTTPAAGLRDLWAGAAYRFADGKRLSGLNAAVVFHRFDSDAGSVKYGTEIDASIGAKLGKVGLLAKYADYDAAGFGTDTRKLWLQMEVAF